MFHFQKLKIYLKYIFYEHVNTQLSFPHAFSAVVLGGSLRGRGRAPLNSICALPCAPVSVNEVIMCVCVCVLDRAYYSKCVFVSTCGIIYPACQPWFVSATNKKNKIKKQKQQKSRQSQTFDARRVLFLFHSKQAVSFSPWHVGQPNARSVHPEHRNTSSTHPSTPTGFNKCVPQMRLLNASGTSPNILPLDMWYMCYESQASGRKGSEW